MGRLELEGGTMFRTTTTVAVVVLAAALLASAASAAGPDAVDRYLASHTNAMDVSYSQVVCSGYPPSCRTVAAPALSFVSDTASSQRIARSLSQSEPPTLVVRSDGFDWADAGIGAAAAIAAALLALLAFAARGRRRGLLAA
jgi:hypothetical protein